MEARAIGPDEGQVEGEQVKAAIPIQVADLDQTTSNARNICRLAVISRLQASERVEVERGWLLV